MIMSSIKAHIWRSCARYRISFGQIVRGSVAIFCGSPGRGIIGARLMLCGADVVQGKTFKGRQFTAEVILWSVRWYLMFPISYHRRIKRLISPGLGFGGFRTARRTLAGFEAMAMIRKGQFDISVETTSGLRVASSQVCSRSRLN